DDALRGQLATLIDTPTWLAAHAERAVSRALGGSCSVPLAAFAQWHGDRLVLRAALGHAQQPAPALLAAQVEGRPGEAQAAGALGEQAAARLSEQGADAYLAES